MSENSQLAFSQTGDIRILDSSSIRSSVRGLPVRVDGSLKSPMPRELGLMLHSNFAVGALNDIDLRGKSDPTNLVKLATPKLLT